MRRTLASPILATSSNSPSAILADVLSASIRTARRGDRVSDGIALPHFSNGLDGQQSTARTSQGTSFNLPIGPSGNLPCWIMSVAASRFDLAFPGPASADRKTLTAVRVLTSRLQA